MGYFPQLTTGAMTQYPTGRERRFRTVMTHTMEGERFLLGDPGAERLESAVELTGLSFAESLAIQDLFSASEGRLRPFVFLDPAGNLLRWSEDFAQGAWTKPAWLQMHAGQPDPLGGTRAVRITNTGVTSGWLRQTVDVPGAFLTVFSVYAKSAAATVLNLRRTAGAYTAHSTVPVLLNWSRTALVAALAEPAGPSVFEIEVPPVTTMELFGAQVEPQGEPSDYHKTGEHGAVWPQSRFMTDELSVVADGVDSYRIATRIDCSR